MKYKYYDFDNELDYSEYDREWVDRIKRENETFEKNQNYLEGKWIVLANLHGILIKKISKVYGSNYDYVLEFNDNFRYYIDESDVEKLVNERHFENFMCGFWLFDNFEDIHIDEKIEKKFIELTKEIKKREEDLKDLKNVFDELKNKLIK